LPPDAAFMARIDVIASLLISKVSHPDKFSA
jgi:hypothetical protein